MIKISLLIYNTIHPRIWVKTKLKNIPEYEEREREKPVLIRYYLTSRPL